eukprot:6211907-Pleurochrysis_carterae.AAC.1
MLNIRDTRKSRVSEALRLLLRGVCIHNVKSSGCSSLVAVVGDSSAPASAPGVVAETDSLTCGTRAR